MGRLLVVVLKNGRRLGAVGCLGRGILGLYVGLRHGEVGLGASTIDVPGGSKPEEIAKWEFGRLKPGDVVTFQLRVSGRRTRPDERERQTPEVKLALAKEALRVSRRRSAARIRQLERMLQTGRFEAPLEAAPASKVRALRVSVGEEMPFTVSAAGALSLSVSLGGVFAPRDRSPRFEASAFATTQRELLTWKLPRPSSVVRVEVLPNGSATRPSTAVRRESPPRSRAGVKREIDGLKAAQRRHEEHVIEFEREFGK